VDIELAKPKNLKTFIIQILRRASLKWPARQEILAASRVERGVYKCAMCNSLFKKEQVHVDHIHPVIPINGTFTTFDDYIERLFCESSELQVICGTCHNLKSKIEIEMRKTVRNTKKEEDKANEVVEEFQDFRSAKRKKIDKEKKG